MQRKLDSNLSKTSGKLKQKKKKKIQNLNEGM